MALEDDIKALEEAIAELKKKQEAGEDVTEALEAKVEELKALKPAEEWIYNVYTDITNDEKKSKENQRWSKPHMAKVVLYICLFRLTQTLQNCTIVISFLCLNFYFNSLINLLSLSR